MTATNVPVSPPTTPAGPEPLPRRPAVAALALALAVLLGAVAGFAGARLLGGAPSDTSVDAGFARDMQTHHAQAVEMAFIVRDRADDEQLRTIALDIITSQQQQMGQMYGWLVQWDLPQTGSEPPMAWMDRAGHDMGSMSADAPSSGAMPGMASAAQLDELRGAEGVEAERLFLSLMIAHHTGGVDMAEAAARSAGTPEVRGLARTIAKAQTAEIALLEDLLAARG